MRARDFSKRSEQAELMDDLSVDFTEFSDCLKALSQVNRLTLARRPTLDFMRKIRARAQGSATPLRILDVGCGYGDMLVFLEKWANKNKFNLELIGVDLNPHATKAALDVAPKDSKIKFITANALDFTQSNDIDVIISSLFTHHLSDRDIVHFIQWMDRTARLGWFINDLYRHPIAYYGFFVLSRLGNFHRFVRHDGPVSIARSFRVADWQRLVRLCALDGTPITIVRWFPFRLCVSAMKSP